MKLSLLSFALLGLLGTAKADSDSCPLNVISCQASGADSCCSPTYGLLVLAQQWSPGYGPANQFTLHGLWPDTCSGAYGPSSGCDSSRSSSTIGTVIRNGDSALYNRMLTYWPSNQGDNNKFWSHEWTKHGTCVSTLKPTCYGDSYKKNQDVIDYFKQTMALRDEYNLYNALSASGITPGGSYDVEDMRDAIQKAFGATAKLDCISGAINEIGLYFYVKGTNTYIPTDTLALGNCKGSVKYPKK
ncbi:base non specific RNase Rh [Choanephora cucurbitarum]|nr:base non specific RNase Rh [Choanephora cucurbitarum]